MSARKTNVPSIPAVGQTPAELAAAAGALKEAVEVGFGRRGDPLDRFLTVRELRDAGVVKVGREAGTNGGVAVLGPGKPDPSDIPDGGDTGLPDNSPPNYGENDPTRPPAPRNVRVVPLPPNRFMVTFDPPSYGNHNYAEVYAIQRSGAGIPTLAQVESGFSSSSTRPHGPTNTNAAWAGNTNGAAFTTAALPRNESDPFSQPEWRFWVRFVSRAGVAGPFTPVGEGVGGQLSLDPGQVLDAMVAGVRRSGIYQNFQQFLGNPQTMTQLIQQGGVTQVYNTTVNNADTLSRIWSVRMAQDIDGIWAVAGFGQSIDRNNETGVISSTFAVNGDIFAVVGGQNQWLRITSVSAGAGQIAVQVDRTPSFVDQLGIRAGTKVVLRAFGSNTSGAWGPPSSSEIEVASVTSAGGTAVLNLQGVNGASLAGNYFNPQGVNARLSRDTSVPFIVDTVRNVVGIRGSLVVDGLVRATRAEFDQLSANEAFFSFIRAEALDANVVVGQRIVAGPGLPAPTGAQATGSIAEAALNQLNEWIVELRRPQPGQLPLRIYNPAATAAGRPDAEVLAFYAGSSATNQAGQLIDPPFLRMRGDLQVGGNGVINMRDGGACAIGGYATNQLGQRRNFTFWLGPDSAYRLGPTTRDQPGGAEAMEQQGYLWVSRNPVSGAIEAAFNADLFLGNDPFTFPSGNGTIRTRAKRTNPQQPVRVYGAATVALYPASENGNITAGVNLWLLPASAQFFGSLGDGATRPVGTVGDTSTLNTNHIYVNNNRSSGIDLRQFGGILLSSTQLNSREGSQDIKNITITGSGMAQPNADYRLLVAIEAKNNNGPHDNHRVFESSMFLVQTDR